MKRPDANRMETLESLIFSALKSNPMTTLDIGRIITQKGNQCPDEIARILGRMRRKGIIKGEISPERGCWIWWVERGTKSE